MATEQRSAELCITMRSGFVHTIQMDLGDAITSRRNLINAMEDSMKGPAQWFNIEGNDSTNDYLSIRWSEIASVGVRHLKG